MIIRKIRDEDYAEVLGIEWNKIWFDTFRIIRKRKRGMAGLFRSKQLDLRYAVGE